MISVYYLILWIVGFLSIYFACFFFVLLRTIGQTVLVDRIQQNVHIITYIMLLMLTRRPHDAGSGSPRTPHRTRD